MWICANCMIPAFEEEEANDPCPFCGSVAWRPYTDVRAERITEVSGIDPDTARLLADVDSTSEFLSVLFGAGYEAEPHITEYCTDDGGPMGYYSVRSGGREIGKIEFDCCGVVIPVKRRIWK